ncbi:hypothetical protein GOAMI_16_01330 [Gordonia amicalis NBRC 100051 = JCM 11271]|nr:hypothetical protein GOAMI_16_01330 [Gordonia amicalis NBRC 100051 = JCM 11271]
MTDRTRADLLAPADRAVRRPRRSRAGSPAVRTRAAPAAGDSAAPAPAAPDPAGRNPAAGRNPVAEVHPAHRDHPEGGSRSRVSSRTPTVADRAVRAARYDPEVHPRHVRHQC